MLLRNRVTNAVAELRHELFAESRRGGFITLLIKGVLITKSHAEPDWLRLMDIIGEIKNAARGGAALVIRSITIIS
jgi:hypothetical protein